MYSREALSLCMCKILSNSSESFSMRAQPQRHDGCVCVCGGGNPAEDKTKISLSQHKLWPFCTGIASWHWKSGFVIPMKLSHPMDASAPILLLFLLLLLLFLTKLGRCTRMLVVEEHSDQTLTEVCLRHLFDHCGIKRWTYNLTYTAFKFLAFS